MMHDQCLSDAILQAVRMSWQKHRRRLIHPVQDERALRSAHRCLSAAQYWTDCSLSEKTSRWYFHAGPCSSTFTVERRYGDLSQVLEANSHCSSNLIITAFSLENPSLTLSYFAKLNATVRADLLFLKRRLRLTVLVGHDRVRTLLRKFFHRRLGAYTRRCVWCRKPKAPKTFLLPACRFS